MALVAKLRALLGDEERRFVIVNSLSGVSFRIVGMILTMVVTAILTRMLGVAEYGRFAFMVSATFLIVLLAGLGLPVAASKLIPRYSKRGRADTVSHYVLVALAVTVLSGLLAGLMLQWLIVLLPALFSPYRFPTTVVIFLVVSVALMRFLSEASRACGLQHVGFFAESVVVRLVLLAILGPFLLYQADLEAEQALAFWVIAQGVVVVLLGVFVLYKLRITQRAFALRSRRIYRGWMSISGMMLITPIYYFLLFETDALILGIMAGPEDVAVYQIARRLAELVVFGAAAVSAVGQPRLSGAHAAKRPDQLQSIVDTINLLIIGSTAPIVIGLILIGPWALQLFGPDFVAGYLPLVILAIGRLVSVLFGPASDLLLMTGHHARLGRVNIICAIANFCLCLALIPPFGATGAALATALTLTAWSGWIYLLAKRSMPIETCLLRRLGSLRGIVRLSSV